MGRLRKISKGFTLLETLVALTILGIALSIFFSILSGSFKKLENLERNLDDFLGLRKAIFLGNMQNVKIREETLKKYGIKARIYIKGNIDFIEVY